MYLYLTPPSEGMRKPSDVTFVPRRSALIALNGASPLGGHEIIFFYFEAIMKIIILYLNLSEVMKIVLLYMKLLEVNENCQPLFFGGQENYPPLF